MTPVARRWLKFNLVGAIGIGVQFGAFAVYHGLGGLATMAATALAVETAVLHNFIWHERYTWRELPRGTTRDVVIRLLKFHAGNGLISIAGNVAVVGLLTHGFHVSPYAANGTGIAVCALANFAASEWFVFRR